jgi:hypothetical protein
MSLMRPEHNLEVGAVQETTLELRILGELNRMNLSVQKIDRNQEMMSVRLLGAIDGDTQHGRLPIVERSVGDHETRLESLEKDRIRYKAYIAAAAAIGGCAGSIITVLSHFATAILSVH